MKRIREKRIITICIKILFLAMLLVTALYGILGELFLPVESLETSGYYEEYMENWNWVLKDGSKKKIDIPIHLNAEEYEEIVIENTLSDNIPSDAYIIFKTSKQDCKIYIDNRQRCEYSTKDSRLWGKTSPSCYIFLKLNPEDSGKKITICTESIDRYRGTFTGIYYANYNGFMRQLFDEQGGTLVFALFMLIIGVLSLVVSIIIGIIYKREQKLASLSLGVIIISAWMVGNSDFRQFIFPNLSVIGDITFLLVALLPIPFAVYMNRLQKERFRGFYVLAATLAEFDFVLCCILYVLGVRDFVESFVLMAAVLFFTICIMFVSIIVDLIKGNIREYWMTALAIALASLVAVIQVMNYLNQDKVFDIAIASMGIVLMLFVAVFDTIRNCQPWRRIGREQWLRVKQRVDFLQICLMKSELR